MFLRHAKKGVSKNNNPTELAGRKNTFPLFRGGGDPFDGAMATERALRVAYKTPLRVTLSIWPETSEN